MLVQEKKHESKVHSLPDTHNNISFVNVSMNLLSSIFYSHLTQWKKPHTCSEYGSFEKFVTILAESPMNGERRMLTLQHQSIFYGLPSIDMEYYGISKVLPKHRYMAGGTPTPNPGEFMESLLQHFRWRPRYEIRCTCCGAVLRSWPSEVDDRNEDVFVLW